MIKVDIRHRFTGAVLFAAEIDSRKGEAPGVALGLAVRTAVAAGADLAGADLVGADLAGANLAGAYLVGADLAGAYLAGANLARANLARANLAGANLVWANLARAELAGANLAMAIDAELVIARTRILPEGALVGWKKLDRGVIAKLEIPAAAKRSHAFGRKCRAEYAVCLEVIGAEFGVSMHDNATIYRAGETIKPHQFDDNWQNECAGGIHFYITREEAEAHT